MAVWQFDFDLVPRARLLELVGHVPDFLSERQAEDVEWCEGHQPLAGFEQILASFLRRGPSWDGRLELWGEEDGNRVDVYTSAGRVTDIFVRVHAGSDYGPFVEGVVELANFCDAVALTSEDMRIIEPTAEAITDALLQSNAARFVCDPQKFFEEMRLRRERR